MTADEGVALGRRIDALSAAAGRLENATAEENIRREVRIAKNEEAIARSHHVARVSQVVAGVALAVAVCAIVVGAVGIHDRAVAEKANDEKRLATCLSAQSAALKSITAGDSHDVIEADKLAPQPRSPEVQSRVDDYLRAQHANTVKQNAIRDCSPLGLHDFYLIPQGPHAFLPAPKLTTPKG